VLCSLEVAVRRCDYLEVKGRARGTLEDKIGNIVCFLIALPMLPVALVFVSTGRVIKQVWSLLRRRAVRPNARGGLRTPAARPSHVEQIDRELRDLARRVIACALEVQ